MEKQREYFVRRSIRAFQYTIVSAASSGEALKKARQLPRENISVHLEMRDPYGSWSAEVIKDRTEEIQNRVHIEGQIQDQVNSKKNKTG